MPVSRPSSSRAQTISGGVILLALALIALGVLYRQAHYDPAAWGRPTLAGGAAATAGGALDLDGLAAPGLKPLGPAERFNSQTLSDKINGKAELYIAAGFQALACRRYALDSDPAAWFEAFVFDMGQSRGAFSVFTVQRRNQGKALDLAPLAHQNGGSLFMLRGRYYLEIIGSSAAPALQEGMRAWARAWLPLAPASQAGPSDLELFPSQGLQAGSLALLASNVFGFDRLDQVFTGSYLLDGQEATLFLSRRDDPAQAAELAQAYAAFLLANGGAEAQAEGLPAGARLVGIMDTFELVFSQGPYLAGVHGGETQAVALELGRRLAARLVEAKP